jgi:hypothetical protein
LLFSKENHAASRQAVSHTQAFSFIDASRLADFNVAVRLLRGLVAAESGRVEARL